MRCWIIVALIIGIMTGCSDTPPAEQTPTVPEDGLNRGVMSIRILDEDRLDALRIEALDVGKDPGSMYPARGPIALGVLPLNRLSLDDMLTVLPLLCEVTVDKDPDRWAAYSEVRILNRHAYVGFRFADLHDSCSTQRAGDIPMGVTDRFVIGEWDAQFLWKLATPLSGGFGADTIGYGTYALPSPN